MIASTIPANDNSQQGMLLPNLPLENRPTLSTQTEGHPTLRSLSRTPIHGPYVRSEFVQLNRLNEPWWALVLPNTSHHAPWFKT